MVNIASRLCDEAAPGEILLTQRAHGAAGDRISATLRGECQLRGVERPVAVWALDAGTETLPALEPSSLTGPLIERPAPAPGGFAVGVLGQTVLVVDGVEQQLRSVKLRQLIGLLAAQRDEVVSVPRLTDQLWNGEPPESAVPALRVYVSRLRKLTGGYADSVLVTRPNGYQLRADADTLDALRFAALADAGRALLAEGSADLAAKTLRAALELWRGTAYADLPDSPTVLGERARLEEERLRAQEDFIDAELVCGRHREANALLEELVIEHPLPGTALGAADDRALPLRPPARGARVLPGAAPAAHRRARPRPVSRTGLIARGHPDPLTGAGRLTAPSRGPAPAAGRRRFGPHP